MKCITTVLFLSLLFYTNAQSSKQKLPKDSVRYYQKEFNKLTATTYDSLKNSAKYKELRSKLDKNEKNVRIELLASAGLYFNDFTNLNARLKSLGQKEVGKTSPSVGVTLAVGYPVMIYGVDIGAYVFDNSTSSFKGFHARVFAGTHLFKRSPIVLNPQIGYAGSILEMYVHKSSNPINLNDLFTTQSNTVQLNHSNDYVDFTLGFKLKSPKRDNFYWQFLRIGYRYGLKETTWSKRGAELIDPPKDRNNQYYFQFCLGFDN